MVSAHIHVRELESHGRNNLNLLTIAHDECVHFEKHARLA